MQRRINSKEGDVHRAASGGGTVVLCPREATQGVRISQANGDEMDVKEGIVSRPLARGGMLVDEPGLGKTITVLSLILQTMGLSTEEGGSSDGHDKGTSDREGGDDEVDDTIFNAYWKESIVPDFRRQALTKLFNDFFVAAPTCSTSSRNRIRFARMVRLRTLLL